MAGINIGLKRIYKKNNKKIFTIHIQNPNIASVYFDLLVVPEHDNLTGKNIIVSEGSLHSVDKKNIKIAYHSACSMQHGQKVHQQPKDLISKTGNEVLEIPEGHLCCGSAGTYNILHQKMAKSLLKNKVKNIEKISPDFISTGNIGCMTQISSGTRIPIIHTVELLDWFTGGPKPYKLNNF